MSICTILKEFSPVLTGKDYLMASDENLSNLEHFVYIITAIRNANNQHFFHEHKESTNKIQDYKDT